MNHMPTAASAPRRWSADRSAVAARVRRRSHMVNWTMPVAPYFGGPTSHGG